MLMNPPDEHTDDGPQPFLRHPGDVVVDHLALAKERVGPALDRVGLQGAVVADLLGSENEGIREAPSL